VAPKAPRADKKAAKGEDEGPLVLDRTTLWEVLALATDDKAARETAFQAAMDRAENKGLSGAAHAFCHQTCRDRALHLEAGEEGLPGACSTCPLARYALTEAEFALLDEDAGEAAETAVPTPAGRLARGTVKPLDAPGTPGRIPAGAVKELEL
jgi:hypothetical protein